VSAFAWHAWQRVRGPEPGRPQLRDGGRAGSAFDLAADFSGRMRWSVDIDVGQAVKHDVMENRHDLAADFAARMLLGVDVDVGQAVQDLRALRLGQCHRAR
jgi:hypothetical protein